MCINSSIEDSLLEQRLNFTTQTLRRSDTYDTSHNKIFQLHINKSTEHKLLYKNFEQEQEKQFLKVFAEAICRVSALSVLSNLDFYIFKSF